MAVEIRQATSAEDREAVYAFRYEIYAEELRFIDGGVDHERRRLRDADDATSRIFYAIEDGHILGTLRLNWGGDGPFTAPTRQAYSLDPFIELLGPGSLIVWSRAMVRPEHRGGGVLLSLISNALAFGVDAGAELSFMDAQPHLIRLYEKMAWRPYKEIIRDPDGILVPMVLARSEFERMERIGAPFLEIMKRRPPSPRLPEILALIESSAAKAGLTRTPAAADDTYWKDLLDLLSADGRESPSLLEGLDPEEVHELLSGSHRIRCRKGDPLIVTDQPIRALFLVVSGAVEVQLEGRTLGYRSAGECVGEAGFLHGLPRMADVVAATDDVEVILINPHTFEALVEKEPRLACRIFRNLSRMLSLRLMQASRGA